VAERVDAAMAAVQATDAQPVLDGAVAEPQRSQLRVRRHGVMGHRELRDPPFQVTFPSHMRG
jgi:hypothetical protein